MNIIFQINGGIGKCILATSIIEEIATQYPEDQLIVMSGYPEVFINNPHVDRAFAFGQSTYFYQDYIEGKDFKVWAHDPYLDTEFLKQHEHLSVTWGRMYGLDIQNIAPHLYLTKREIEFFSNKYMSEKPILLMQTNGGAQNQELKYSWARDIPTCVVNPVIEEFKNQYHIVHIKREDQIGYQGTTPVTDGFRALTVLIGLSAKRLFMDSFGQHTAAALNKSSTVLWIANKPEVFGYPIHDNILANPETKTPELRHAYIQKYDIGGNIMEFPYNSELDIFNVDAVIKSIKNQQ